ncbi:RNA-binding protein 10 [Penaeus vannamei]|uniref:RNA-binding protein 10 n=1 Tax=Penaeus vannamei TaxID=6689 RepID=A0A3R7QMJ5_PENVA|nr:RNA-binding protein 10 [Penaeus vannamei]
MTPHGGWKPNRYRGESPPARPGPRQFPRQGLWTPGRGQGVTAQPTLPVTLASATTTTTVNVLTRTSTTTKSRHHGSSSSQGVGTPSSCGAHNFKRRDSCFKCSAPRHESEAGEEGSDEVCTYPTNTLLLRGLDVLSTEESVLQGIQHVGSDLPIRSVRIGRDPLTNTSRGVCYIELNSVLDSMQLHNKLAHAPPTIDGKQVTISYCKLNPNNGNEYTAGADIKQLAEYSASLYAQTPEEHASYVQYYTMYYQQQAQTVTQTTPGSANYDGVQLQTGEYPTYPPPDVSTYQYDETSGYYYDPSTTLYYDASSNTTTMLSGQYLYWDAEKSTYLPAPVGEDGHEGKKGDKKEKEKDKQDKVKVAKKIAKDMERWAKAQNKRNESAITGKAATAEPAGGSREGSGTGAADAAFAVLLERRDRASLVEKQSQVFQMHMKKDSAPVLASMKKSGLVAAYGGEGSDSEEETGAGLGGMGGEERLEEKLVDYTKMACLLCKRQFPNKEALGRHVQLSDLHKTNLEAMRKSRGSGDGAGGLGGMTAAQYRDRAKERRQKYGEPSVPAPNKLKERYMAAREEVEATKYEEPTKQGIGSDNIGNKLLKKMGWTDGQGLGKANQGRTSIIETERRVATAGLGMQGSTYSVVGDSYKDCVKKMMFHRYQELDAQEKSVKS